MVVYRNFSVIKPEAYSHIQKQWQRGTLTGSQGSLYSQVIKLEAYSLYL